MASSVKDSENVNDVFDEECNDIDLADREWNKVKLARLKEGYIDGMSKGQDLILQRAFNDGFTSAVGRSHTLGRLRGTLSAILGQHLLGVPASEALDSTAKEEIESMIEKLSNLEKEFHSFPNTTQYKGYDTHVGANSDHKNLTEADTHELTESMEGGKDKVLDKCKSCRCDSACSCSVGVDTVMIPTCDKSRHEQNCQVFDNQIAKVKEQCMNLLGKLNFND